MTPQDIYLRYGALVYRRAYRLLGDEQAAKDACQEVFLGLFRSLRSVGEFPAAQILQMNGVGADEVRRALIELNARLRQESADTVLLVYYSGHADAEYLHLSGSHLGARELRDILAGSSAGSRVLVIDACRSGAVTRVKGGSPTTPFTVNLGEVSPPTGLAIMTSSAEGEDSQESDSLAGSFFTHYCNSGLIGAADQNCLDYRLAPTTTSVAWAPPVPFTASASRRT
jgi:hypothetical protein